MLTLMLLRHAKAEPGGNGDDFARALTPKGEVDAGRLGRYLARVGCVPDRVLASAARRTQQTIEIAAAQMGAPVTIGLERRLYDATPARIRDAVAAVEPDVRRLMVVGHNPGIMDLAVGLAGGGDPPDLQRLRSRFPPCGLAVVVFRGDGWEAVAPGAGRLDVFVTPEEMSAAG